MKSKPDPGPPTPDPLALAAILSFSRGLLSFVGRTARGALSTSRR